MTIASTTAKKIYVTNDSTTEFPFAYKFYETSDLVVTLYTIADGTSEVLTEETDYTIEGGDDGEGGTTDYTSGGTVILTEAAGDGYKLIIERVLPITQEYDYVPNDPFPEDSHEEAMDRIVMILQQQQTIIDRCIKMDKSNTSVESVFDIDDLDVTIPSFAVSDQTEKTSISSDDYFAIADSADGDLNKKVKQSNILNFNGETEKTALHANDIFLIEDSQASYVKKKVKRNNVIPISTQTEKTAVHADDLFLIEDSEASNVKKKVKSKNAIIVNTLTEKTSLHDDDLILIEDSEASNAKKKVKKSNFVNTSIEVFTENGTFTAPAGVTSVIVTLLGGGGGGGGATGASGGSGGGGGGCIINRPYTVTPGGEYAVVVGAGGAAGVQAKGGTGGTSSFDGTISVTGGVGGDADSSSSPGSGAAGMSAGASGKAQFEGCDGSGQSGGASYFGLGANVSNDALANSGGGGGGRATGTSGNGNAGGSGLVIVQW